MNLRILFVPLLAVMLLAGCTEQAQSPQQNSTGAGTGTNGTVPQNQNPNPPAYYDNATGAADSSGIDFHKEYSDDGKLMVYFFYSPSCPSCKAIRPFVESIGANYSNVTEWHGFDLTKKADRDEYFRFFKEFNLPQSRSGTPTILVANTVLWGRYEINDSLEKLIIEHAPAARS